MVAAGYSHIWDCCCDHGFLGAALLARGAAANIHFVDVVPELMRDLEAKLMRFYPAASALTTNTQTHWQVHCMDVAALPLRDYSGTHLVIIAGVGGDLMAELVAAICDRHAGLTLDFLLCPVHHHFSVRQALIARGFGLRNEVLMQENQRYYEILWVASANQTLRDAVAPAGSLLWQADTPEQLRLARDYLAKTLAHYQRMQLNGRVDVQPIIAAFQAIKI
jgi:tRNA (adenine22-N1)-methyltransferase